VASAHDDGLFLEWDAITGDPMKVIVEGSCIRDFAATVHHDRGELFIEPGELRWRGDRDCEVLVTLERSRFGRLDPRFGGGHIRAKRLRQMALPLTY
jgi:hypothetical protein